MVQALKGRELNHRFPDLSAETPLAPGIFLAGLTRPITKALLEASPSSLFQSICYPIPVRMDMDAP